MSQVAGGRYRPNVVVRVNSPNKSSREGARPILITVHSTEGRNIPHSASDLLGVSRFLCQPPVQASAHVCTDNDGHSSRIVRDRDKAWHCMAFNRISLGIEQIGFAATEHWSLEQYRETARWVAEWNKLYGIPIQRARVSGLLVVRWGVVEHSELGVAGGGHHDPGTRFDIERMLYIAKRIRRKL